MSFSGWIRRIHRWLSAAFTLAVVANLGALALPEYPMWIGYVALAPLWLLIFSGVYLFALPYFPKRRAVNGPAEGTS